MQPTYLYRHDEIILPRPFAFDVDTNDWLWEGTTHDRLLGHNLRTAELRVVEIPEMEGHIVFEAFAWQDKVFLILGECQFYLVFDPATGRTERYQLPGDRPICWYGSKLPDGRLMIFDRRNAQVYIFSAPDAPTLTVRCPWDGDLPSGKPASDGLVYITLADPARLVRFDPATNRFVDEQPVPWPEVGMSGRFEHKGIMYFADSAGGRLLPLDLQTQQWGEPIAHPDHGKVFGFIGGGFGFQGKGYFCLSTYAARSRLDVKTGKLIMPEGKLPTVDGRPLRFMERFLVFDPEQQTFDYLCAPEQPDGLPLLCYAWADEKRFAITGMILPWGAPGEPQALEQGHWLILQSESADEEPGFGAFDFNWDRAHHLQGYRRSYPKRASLFLTELPYTPPIENMHGPAVHYPHGRKAEFTRRAERTDAKAYWQQIVRRLLPPDADTATQFRLILEHVQHVIYYNPIQMLDASNPIAIHEAHDGRCGHAVEIVLALCAAAGIEARSVPLRAHIVAEAFYDDAWHYGDPLFFGGNQPAREGRVLSAEELIADPYFADIYPQQCFAYDPELLMSEDNFQMLGYVFGMWGSEPYYSYYLGAPKEQPPTLPVVLPAQRLSDNAVRINWSPSVKWNGGQIEYELRIFTDRACTQEVLRHTTSQISFEFQVPEPNRMYFLDVRAMDEHRALQPQTWYPAARFNFVLVPRDQYGWYGVL